MIDPVALATITSAVSVLGTEYLKGFSTEAGKATWTGVKALFRWASDPEPAEIPEKVATTLTASPDLTEKLLELLKNNQTGTASAMVGKISVSGGKVVVANTIVTDHFQM
ncbi:MAG: hypothetical protein WBW33_28950 [Bryobacteraceae bacterium]